MKLPISLVTVVRNASGRLKTLIEAHRDLVSEVVVVDQGSTDGTYEEAVSLANKVFRKRCKGTSDPDRNWAFSLASQPYVLYLDDDEVLTDEAKAALPSVIATGGDVFWLNRDNFIDGVDVKEIMGTDPQCRLFKKGAVRFPDRIHSFPEPAIDTKVFFLNVAIRHDRTWEQVVKANKTREVVADERLINHQNKFMADVRELLDKGLKHEKS